MVERPRRRTHARSTAAPSAGPGARPRSSGARRVAGGPAGDGDLVLQRHFGQVGLARGLADHRDDRCMPHRRDPRADPVEGAEVVDPDQVSPTGPADRSTPAASGPPRAPTDPATTPGRHRSPPPRPTAVARRRPRRRTPRTRGRGGPAQPGRRRERSPPQSSRWAAQHRRARRTRSAGRGRGARGSVHSRTGVVFVSRFHAPDFACSATEVRSPRGCALVIHEPSDSPRTTRW